ncbi:hypothetical protein [Nocardioides sp.]|uniref:hypothetical protein n=1 Tax=Nocardioides sp. TaxID=35761 RepID=UPI0035665B26
MTATTMTQALQHLELLLVPPSETGVPLGNWRWAVRQRMAGVRDHLMEEGAQPNDGWLAARGGSAVRERNALLLRLSDLAPRILEHPDVDEVCAELRRLHADIIHHLQRVRDLAYDDVEIEFGGSE